MSINGAMLLKPYVPVQWPYATWNPSTKTANGILSNWDLTFSVGTVPGWQYPSVISTIWKSSWKWYWELYVNSQWVDAVFGIGTLMIWLSSQATIIDETVNLWQASYLWGNKIFFDMAINAPFWGYNDTYIHNGTTDSHAALVAPYAWNNGFALDMDAWTLTMYRPTSPLWTSSTMWLSAVFSWLTGTIYPALCFTQWYGWVADYSATVNFWDTAFQNTPPSGFNAWLY